MLQLLKNHKKHIIIICTAILLCSLLAVLFASRYIKPKSVEEFPVGRIHDAGVFGDKIAVHDSAEGEIVIGANSSEESVSDVILTATPLKTVSDPETIWSEDTYAGKRTPIEKAQMKNGSIGVLTIPKLNLSVNVYESSDNMEAMSKPVKPWPPLTLC